MSSNDHDDKGENSFRLKYRDFIVEAQGLAVVLIFAVLGAILVFSKLL